MFAFCTHNSKVSMHMITPGRSSRETSARGGETYNTCVQESSCRQSNHSKQPSRGCAAANARADAAEEALRAYMAQWEDNDDDDDDDDEDEDEDEGPPARAAVGGNLRALWQVAGGPARRGARAGGRRRKSGPEMIASAAAKITAAATPSPLLAAGAAPCLLAPLGAVENRGRPTHSLTIPADGDNQPRQFQAAAYHITWCARANQPPPIGQIEYSHRCHQKRCVEPTHGVWETRGVNRGREACRAVGGAGCGHNLLNSRL